MFGFIWAVMQWIWTVTWEASWLGAGIRAGLAYLGGRLLDEETADQPMSSADSQSRSWVPHTTHREGLARPRAYGKNLHHGNIVASWTDVASNREVLYVIVDHGDGPTKGIVGGVGGEVYLNDQPTGNYGDVVVQERLGTMDQTVMTGFEKTKIEYPLNKSALYNEAYVFTTPNDNFDDIEYTLHFPQGIIKYHKDGKSTHTTCNFLVRISVAGADSWTTLLNGSIGSYETVDPVFKLYKVSDQGFNCVRGTRYDLEITRTVPVSARIHNTSYIRSVREVVDIAFTRPGKVLVGIKAIATGQLSGSLDIKVVREDRLINVYNGSVWAIGYSRNRAWVTFDVLTQPIISGSSPPYTIERYEGIDPTKLDVAFFYTWAQYCDAMIPDGYGGTEIRSACDIIVDYQTDIWTLANEIAHIGRASLYWKGDTVTGWIDTVVPTPIDLVTMDNTMSKTWKNARTGKDELAGQIEVMFQDSRLGYERTSASWSNVNAGIHTNIVNIEGVGITTRGTAVHVANHLLLRNQLINNTNRFRMHKDAFRYSLGKVIRLQHRVPNFGHGYRAVLSTGANVVTLDRDASDDVSVGDTLYIRSYDSATEQPVTDVYTVQGVSGKVVAITTTWDVTPVKGNLVAIGPAGGIKLRRIIKMEPDVKNYFDITVETYDVSLFDADDLDPLLPDQNYIWPAPARRLNEYMTQEAALALVNDARPQQAEIDAPTTSNLTWTGSGGDTVTWTATDPDEPIQFNIAGVEYEIPSSSTVNKFIYWNPSSPTSFLNTNDVTVARAPGNWIVCRNDDGVVGSAQAMQLLHGGIIQAGTITATLAQIAALAVVTGNINDLAVTTLKIQDDAVTIPVSAYTAGSTGDQSGETTVQSAAFTSVGSAIFINFSITLLYMSGSSGNWSVRLYRDASLILESPPVDRYFSSDNPEPYSYSMVDTPGAGSYTYYIKVNETGDLTYAASKRALLLLETKK